MGELVHITQHASMKGLQAPTFRRRQSLRDAKGLEISKGTSNAA
jgi:hypothetical protein